MQKHPQTVFGARLRAAREAAGLPQDKLGVAIGLDESCSSARISRYETGAHQPPFETAELLAKVLRIPAAYLYCRSEMLGHLLLCTRDLSDADLKQLAETAEQIANSRPRRKKFPLDPQ